MNLSRASFRPVFVLHDAADDQHPSSQPHDAADDHVTGAHQANQATAAMIVTASSNSL
jgi:hypothetical protein